MSNSLYFIDTNVVDYQSVVEDLPSEVSSYSEFDLDPIALSTYNGSLSTFNLDSLPQYHPSKIMSQIIKGDTLLIQSYSQLMTIYDINSADVYASGFSGNTLVTGEFSGERMVTLSVDGGKVFDLKGFNLCDYYYMRQNLKITTDKGSMTFSSGFSKSDSGWTISLDNPIFQGITYAQITTDNSSGFSWAFDNFILNNINTPLPSTTISSFIFSVDTGVNNRDFITNSISQTIRRTPSNNIISSEMVQVSFDNWNTRRVL